MYDSVEHIEDFTVDGNGYATDEPAHDAAGNLTYDGQYAYTYDAWNRMVASHRAFRTPSGTGTLTLGSTVLAVRYDGLGRRIERTITHSGDFDATYHDYHDPGGHSVIEIRNGSNLVLKQHVWAAPGNSYIDELVQVALNADPFTDEDFTDTGPGSAGGRFYFALQDANFNVLALVDADGSLAERYEYTPYGQRQVYYSPGPNDPNAHAPYLTSRRWKVGTADQPYGLNDLGHQGLHHDEVSGLVYQRERMWNVQLGRFNQPDPLGYPDGMNRYAGYHILHGGLDPLGLHRYHPWQARSDIRAEKQLWSWRETRWVNTPIFFGYLPRPKAESFYQQADFQVYYTTVYNLNIITIGQSKPRSPRTGDPYGSPGSGDITLPGIWSTTGWGNLSRGVRDANRGNLVSMPCKKDIYLIQQCCRDWDGGWWWNPSGTETAERYVKFSIMGEIAETLGNYSCDAREVERNISRWVQSMNQSGETICDGMPHLIYGDDGSVTQGHMDAFSDPSATLVPLSSSYSVWDEQSTQLDPRP